jgi:predicted nucleotidyltransferase component of viral defense system
MPKKAGAFFMKEYLLELVNEKSSRDEKFNRMREYLQSYILSIFQDQGGFRYYCFVGGTALRILYGLPRFSEDLDFSLAREPDFSFSEILKKVETRLNASGYEAGIRYKENRALRSALIKFERLLYDVGLSPLKSQKFSIKMEADMNPPPGAVNETKIVNEFFPLAILTYDIPCLFAGKIHALLSRPYVKGRDYYDLAWYLSRYKGISPNTDFLNNALRQTGWDKDFPTKKNWKDLLKKVVRTADWKQVEKDVLPFLERPGDMNIFTKENVLSLLKEE